MPNLNLTEGAVALEYRYVKSHPTIESKLVVATTRMHAMHDKKRHTMKIQARQTIKVLSSIIFIYLFIYCCNRLVGVAAESCIQQKKHHHPPKIAFRLQTNAVKAMPVGLVSNWFP